MTIRAATDQDISAIVELLKISLGEGLMPKSEAFWRWKHIDNPFGKSPVLLAVEDDQLIGVRAFMKWEWRLGDKIYKAVRAVDTATHPQHQGKGIFKKLTLQLVDQCKSEGIDFIFNTPNKSSKPGYLKMGWMSNGKMKLNIRPVFFQKAKLNDFDQRYSINKSLIPFSESFHQTLTLTTNISTQFLNWRYCINPNIRYYSFSDGEVKPSYLVFFRLKPYRFGIEFRICDVFITDKVNQLDLRKHVKKVADSSGANLITSAQHIGLLPSLTLPLGPEITTRPLSIDHNFLTFNIWRPSLGDMEVF